MTSDPRNNLPVQLTSFVGRQRDLDELAVLLESSRLLTLVGSGGIGKTRLALEVAAGQAERWPDGVWLIELAPVVDPVFVAQRLATVVGVRETPEQSLTNALQDALRDRRTFIVLDNCEHLLDACAHLVDGLLRTCPGLRILVTSREPLGIGGEVVWRVPSLAVPNSDEQASTLDMLLGYAAVQLFVDRAKAARPGFALTTRNSPAVARICRRLDGIPLALELAAARLEALTAEQIANRLDQRLRLLTGGSRVALPRQQTLAATLDWSYELLTQPERRLFERLAVFSGGWTLEAAEHVCADEELLRDDVLEVMTALTRKSLVVAEEQADRAERYSLLETLREYACQRLASNGAAYLSRLRDRHAEFYSLMTEQMQPDVFGRSSVEATAIDALLGLIDSEQDNIRATLAACLESGRCSAGVRLVCRLNRVWVARGLDAEARHWLMAFLEFTAQQDEIRPADRAAALTLLISSAVREGEYLEARKWCEQCVQLWRELGDDLGLAITLCDRGLVAWLLGNTIEAMEYLRESRRVFDRCPRDSITVAYSTNVLRSFGLVARSQGDYTQAAKYFRESVALARVGMPTGGYTEARGVAHLARTLFLQGNLAECKCGYVEALTLIQHERLSGHTLADCLDWAAALADVEGRTRTAAFLFGAGAAEWQASAVVRYAPEQAAYANELGSVQGKLSAEEFAAAWAEGRAAPREQAVDLALELLRELP